MIAYVFLLFSMGWLFGRGGGFGGLIDLSGCGAADGLIRGDEEDGGCCGE